MRTSKTMSRAWRPWASAAALLTILSSVGGWAADPTLPIVQNEFSIFNGLPSDNTSRSLTFKLTDPNLVAEYVPPSSSPYPEGLNTNDSDVVADAVYFSYALGTWYNQKAPETRGCQDQGTATGSGGSTLLVAAQMLVQTQDNLQDELQNRIIPLLGNSTLGSYSPSEVSIPMKITGGAFNGKTIQLSGVMSSATGEDPNDDDSQETWEADLFVAVNWGVDPFGNHEYVLFRFTYAVGASTSISECLSLTDVCNDQLGAATCVAYGSPKFDALLSEVGTTQMQITGAAPELLCLYDFSGSNTVSPQHLVPAGMLDPSVVVPQVYAEDTNLYKYFNQYDAGVYFNLPGRFHSPNPVPPPNGLTPGGNACGPTSLGMALYNQGVSSVDLRSVFDNTTVSGINVGGANGFFWPRAEDWLAGKPKYGAVSYSSPTPLSSGAVISYDYATDLSVTGSDIRSVWSDIDFILDKKQPVLVRTDLSLGTSAGGGHVVLFLGRGHNSTVGSLYGTSGDYYIVADPAGHYYGNEKGMHYGTALELRIQDVGLNYAGWYAMYPKERIQKRITDGTNADFRMTALTIGAPFPGSFQTYTLHSPLTLLLTDPLGRQTGVKPDGELLQNIPNSQWIPPIDDEEEDGIATIHADGPKTIQVRGGMEGFYGLQLVGTNNGTFELDWTITRADSTLADSETISNTVTTGQEFDYQVNVLTGDPPTLQTIPNGSSLSLFWPTNATGYALQSSPTLGAGAIWTPANPPLTETNGENAATISTSSGTQFYRLMK